MKKFYDNYFDTLLFITISVLVLSVAFTLITGMSPLEALNIKPLAATLAFTGMITLFIILPILVNRLRERE
ncbi:MAG: hypothetical protein AAGN35_20480 [Bacteroidota bacterium]